MLGVVGVALTVAIEEIDYLLAALGSLDDAVGQRFLGKLGDVGSLAVVAAVLDMRGAHHRDFESLRQLGMLVGIDQFVGDLGRIVGVSYSYRFARRAFSPPSKKP